MKARRVTLRPKVRTGMEIAFTKMHGLGNDFMVVRWPDDVALPSAERVRGWGHRRTGVGFDQLLLLGTPADTTVRAQLSIINSDGSRAQQCGNGIRCVARFLAQAAEDEFLIGTAAGPIAVRVQGERDVSANLGEPRFEPEAVPFAAAQRALRYRLNLTTGEVEFGVVSMGNPHAVVAVDSVASAPVSILGPELEQHPSFPQGVNVGFMQRVAADAICLRVFERGAGETLACGTGAAAAVALGRIWELLGSHVTVALPGGELVVDWQGPGSDLWQSGPAEQVYEARISL
ncbi:MAG TPA: diaminopimelate epimerase [Gammaproteobacteria bacterium]|nr:diaminopimelate epimerase [Gammaproteobacteria bacterium]